MSAGQVADMLEMEIPENPFPGLRPFEFNESLLYFGRDGQSEQLLRKLSATRFLAVVGTSGSGKSSLVRAGLLPALLGGFMTNASSNWQIALMRPGFDPIGNLARALAAPDVLGSNGDQDVESAMAESTLRRGNFGLLDLAQQARIGPSQNLLIVADQFEELFRVAGFAESEAYRNHAAAFVKLLLEASRQRELAIYVVLTMRSDFLGDCSSFWGLPEAINEGQYLIPRLTREQRREAITGPIAVCGGAITDRLVTRLLNDIGDDQDQLPLLQHALMRTWGKWKEGHDGRPAIDLEHYESIGGMSDALSLHVDEAYNSLPDERSREVTEKVFKGLTEKGSDNREIRRPVTLAGLSVVTGAGESELAPVIDTFRQQGRSFLMPPAEVPLTSAAMIDISHESLIRNWSRLKEWVEEEARSARIYRRLAETAALYREGNASLWRDPDLQVALTWREQSRPNKEWADRYHHRFEEAMSFLDESLAERGAEQLAREAERRDKELRRTRQVRNARVTTIAVALALMVSLGTLVYANRQKQRAIVANEQSERLLYLTIFKQAQRAFRAKDFARADELLTNSAKDSRSFEWYLLWNRCHSAEHTIKGYERSLTSVTFSPTRKSLIATGSADGTLALIDSLSGKSELLNTSASSVWGSVFSPDGNILAVLGDVLGESNRIELWDVASKQSLGSLPRKQGDLQVECIAFWQGGKVAGGNEQGSITVWDLEAPYNRETLPYPGPPEDAMPDVVALASSPRVNFLASGYENGALWIWKPGSRKAAKLPFDRGQITTLAVSPDGQLLAVATKEGWLAIWVTADILRREGSNKGQKQERPFFEKQLLSGDSNCLAFSEDGKVLATTGADGAVSFWDMEKLRHLRSKPDGLEQTPPSARTDSELKTTDERLQALKIAASGGLQPARDPLPLEHSGPITSMAFSGDGNTFASGSSDKTVKIWRLGNGKNQEKGVISPDGRLVAIVRSGVIRVLEAGQLRSTFRIDPDRMVSSMIFSPDSNAMVAGLDDGTVKLYHPKADMEIDLPIGRWEISSDARFISCRNGEGVRVWDTSRGEVSHEFLAQGGFKIQSQGFSPDGKAIAVSYGDGTAKVYYLETDEEFEIAKMGRGNQRVSFDLNSKFLQLIGYGYGPANRQTEVEFTKTWNVKERRLASIDEMESISELEEPEHPLTVSSPSGGKIASAKDDTITLSDVTKNHSITKTNVHLVRVTSLAFSPNGETLASGGLDGTVKLWDASNLAYRSDIRALRKTDGTLNRIVSLAFSNDGKRLAIGTDTDKGTLIFWDLLAGQELLRLPETLPPSSAFAAGDIALGSHTLERIWVGALEEARVSSLSREKARPGAAFSWVSSRDEVAIPANALIAGYSSKDNAFLRVCRLRYKNNWYVGHTWGGDCHIGDVGELRRQFNFGSYEILVNAGDTSWLVNKKEKSEDPSSKPPRIIAGKPEVGKEVAICRATTPNGTYIGWTVGDECHISNGAAPLKFEILHEKGIEGTITASSKRK